MEEKQWTLHSKARWVGLDGGLEGPCRAKAKMNIFTMKEYHWHSDCMKHCKMLGGRSPSVETEAEWEYLVKELKAVSPDPSKLPAQIWLSATVGYIGYKLAKLDQWPQGVEAEEGVWRDFYTGRQLENYTKPWYTSNGDKGSGTNSQYCIYFKPILTETKTWVDYVCDGQGWGFPCEYRTPPLIHMRGFCPDTNVEHTRYTVSQSASDPKNIIMVGRQSAKIQYDSSLSQWIYSDPRLNVTAKSRASQNSFALGKHNWTVSGDKYQCFEGKDYR